MSILITRKDYEALPEGTPMELCDGMLVKQPSPRYGHQRIQARVLSALTTLLGVDRVVAGPVDVRVDELNVFAPDIVVLETIPPDEAQYVGVPLLVCEVLSPSTRARDRDYKARRLLGLGVKEIWLFDPEEQAIEIVDLEGSRTARAECPARSTVVEGLSLVPAALFARP